MKGRLLAVDWGERRIGLALSDETQTLAQPLTTLIRRAGKRFPMAQLLDTRQEESRVTVSCLVSDLRFEWRLEPDGEGTTITVDVEIPEAEAHRLQTQRDVIKQLGIDLNLVWHLVSRLTSVIIDAILWLTGNT